MSICIGTFNYEENTQNKNLENNAFSYGPSLEIKFGKAFKIFSLLELGKRYYYFSKQPIESNFQLITTLNLERDLNAKLWGKITLTPKQNDVTETLKIIEQNLDGINIIQSTDTGQKPLAVVKLKNEMNVVPMKSLGDGINRIFNISLALVNSDNGYLLIDEFENGLHYSVQEKLWEIIFTMSKKLNVQVFATTHSYDCVRAFEKIVNNGFKDEGALIKLENVNGEVKNVRFDSNELLIASEHNIELR